MALDESVLSDLLAAVKAGDGVELVRELAQWGLQQLINAEAAAVIGADRYERTDSRTNERNGTRPRLLTTATGDLTVGIPKLRKGSFFPAVLEPRRRIDQALHAVIMEAYVSGVSTRSVDDLVMAMGGAAGVSRSEVSRICAGLERTGRRVPQPDPGPRRVPVRVPRRRRRRSHAPSLARTGGPRDAPATGYLPRPEQRRRPGGEPHRSGTHR